MIRPATPDDYAAIVAVNNAALPEYRTSVERLYVLDATRDPRCKLGYLAAEVDDAIVAYARYMQFSDVYHPQVFHVLVFVQPEFRRRGLGKELYAGLLDTLKEDNPILFKSFVYENYEDAQKFAQSLGFVEYSRRIESELALGPFDASPYQEGIQALEASGIQIKSVADLADDPERDEKIYRLQWMLELDVPLDETLTQPSMKQWRIEVIDNSSFLPQASFIAVDDDEYIGLTEVFDFGDEGCYVQFTATMSSYRRRGIALAMKVRGIEWAQANGFHRMGTTNDAVNTGMIAMNRALGFVPSPTRIQLEKSFEA